MKNYIFESARVSTEQQNLDRQLDALRKYGCDMIYNEKMTGTKRNRPELARAICANTVRNQRIETSLRNEKQEHRRRLAGQRYQAGPGSERASYGESLPS